MTKEEFKAWRASKGLTQDKMGIFLDRTLRTIQYWEKGVNQVPSWVDRIKQGEK